MLYLHNFLKFLKKKPEIVITIKYNNKELTSVFLCLLYPSNSVHVLVFRATDRYIQCVLQMKLAMDKPTSITHSAIPVLNNSQFAQFYLGSVELTYIPKWFTNRT